jgi:hypothetical protein
VEREVEAAIRLAGDKAQLVSFGNEVLRRVREYAGAAPISVKEDNGPTNGWKSVDSTNFRIMVAKESALVEQVRRALENARVGAFEKWYGTPPTRWSPPCDVVLHADRHAYARVTGKPADSPGHSTIEFRAGRVVARRIDLSLDNVSLLTVTLPHEVTHVVLGDLFEDQPLPRWADEGMAVMAEEPDHTARVRRMLPKLRKEGKVVAVSQIVTSTDFPGADSITAFYVQSFTLVEYLCSLRGPKAFAMYLRDAQRYGYEKALERSFGIRSFTDLQQRWERATEAANR